MPNNRFRADLARLLLSAVEASGRARCDIARGAQIHKDALRRVLAGERSASLGEALRILAASGVAPHAHLLLFLVSSGDHAIAWLQPFDRSLSLAAHSCGTKASQADPIAVAFPTS